MKWVLWALALMSCNVAWGGDVEQSQRAADEAAIREAVANYVAAYNRADAQALAQLWSPEAVYTDRSNGEQVTGRAAIEERFKSIFADQAGTRLDAQSTSIEFVSPNVAVERGTATIAAADESAEAAQYSAVYVKRDGQWLLDRVTEDVAPANASNYEQLKELEWMIGDWVDEDDEGRVETTCAWTKNRNFITRWFSLSVGGQVELSGLQIVGWDPATQRIRSWVFDSDGGFGDGVWSKHGDTWRIRSQGVLPDGRRSSAVNIITRVNDDAFTWQSVDREADGEILPNVDEAVAVRRTGADE